MGEAILGVDFTKIDRVERTIDAMPILIDYISPWAYVLCKVEGEDFRFVPCFPEKSDSNYANQIKYRDAYKIRDAFLAVDSPSEGLCFLNEAGEFWPLHSLRWSEFQRWQTFVVTVSQHSFFDTTPEDPEASQAWSAITGSPNTFFPPHDRGPEYPEMERSMARLIEIFPRSAETPASSIDLANKREAKALHELPMAFAHPPEGALSIEYGPTDKSEYLCAVEILARLENEAKERVAEMERTTEPNAKERLAEGLSYIEGLVAKAQLAKKDASQRLETNSRLAVERRVAKGPVNLQREDYMPVLHIKARNVLEAIAATVCADRWHGVRKGRCKHCQKLFELESEHGQQFCKARGENASSSCKNAFRAKELRDRKRSQKNAAKLASQT